MEYSLFKKIQIKKSIFEQKIHIFPKVHTKIHTFFRAQKSIHPAVLVHSYFSSENKLQQMDLKIDWNCYKTIFERGNG